MSVRVWTPSLITWTIHTQHLRWIERGKRPLRHPFGVRSSRLFGRFFRTFWTCDVFFSDGILGFLFEVVFVFSSEQLFSMLPLILDLVSFGESYSLITFKEHNCLLFEKSWYLFTVDNSIVSEEAALVILYIVWRNCHLFPSIYATLVVIIYI